MLYMGQQETLSPCFDRKSEIKNTKNMFDRVSKWELGGNNAVLYLSGNLCLILLASPC